MLLASMQQIAEMAGGSVNTASVMPNSGGGGRWRGGCPGDSDECVIMEVRAPSGWDLSCVCVWDGGDGGGRELLSPASLGLRVGGEREDGPRQQGASD